MLHIKTLENNDLLVSVKESYHFFKRLRNDQNRGNETAGEKSQVRINRKYGYEMTENHSYEMSRVRNDCNWLNLPRKIMI